jgi:hypothetical protein
VPPSLRSAGAPRTSRGRGTRPTDKKGGPWHNQGPPLRRGDSGPMSAFSGTFYHTLPRP